MAKTDVLGIGAMRANFAELKDGMQTRVSRAMVVSGGKIIKQEARSIALAKGLRKTGALINNIVIKREPAAPADTTQYNLGVRHGRNLTKKQKTKSKLAQNARGRVVTRYENDPYYWKFLEFGTVKRQATPFLAPALENRKADVITAMGDRLNIELLKVQKS